MSYTLYHGSQFIIERPVPDGGNPFNDFGPGFYCTESEALAKEWACAMGQDGFANRYVLETDGLSVLRLSDCPGGILAWLAVLLNNRRFDLDSDAAKENGEYVKAVFLPAISDYDVVTGYRGDDSFFSFASSFLKNRIPLSEFLSAVAGEADGEQVVLRTERAFGALTLEESIPADRAVFYPKRMERDSRMRSAGGKRKKIGKKHGEETKVLLNEIRKEGWKSDDARLR